MLQAPVTPLEFWFDLASPYSYLAAARLPALAAAHGVAVVWRPFLLGPIFQRLGWASTPFAEHPAKQAYLWRDLARQAEKYGLAFRQPARFPQPAVLATRLAVRHADADWLPDFCQAMLRAQFAEGADPAAPEVIDRALTVSGLAPHRARADAAQPAVGQALRARIHQAEARGLFGAPSFWVAGELFWGNDRLEEAVEWAVRR
jgi:2-hydroxychromene-2-carboxylate isomerase